jgi:uncharacterized membrane protein YgdD (TMEM256/DUF423 family)
VVLSIVGWSGGTPRPPPFFLLLFLHRHHHHDDLILLLFPPSSRRSTVPWDTVSSCWLYGTFLFSGSLYGLSLGGPRLLGPVTPIGGLIMLAGWGSLFMGSEGGSKATSE